MLRVTFCHLLIAVATTLTPKLPLKELKAIFNGFRDVTHSEWDNPAWSSEASRGKESLRHPSLSSEIISVALVATAVVSESRVHSLAKL
jgi:hypothetical protein